MRVDPLYVSNLSAAVDQSAYTEETLTQELASGVSIQQLSDNPTGVSQVTQYASQLSTLDTFVKTATTEQSMMQVGDSALGQAVTELTSAITVATGAANGTESSSDLAAAAQNIAGIRDQVLSLANTSYQGQYLYSGSQGSTKPFTLDSTSTPAVATYNGDSKTVSTVTPYGQSVQVSLPGSTIFQPALDSLNQLQADIAAGNTSAIEADTTAVTAAMSNVSLQRSVLGSSMSQLTSLSTYVQTQATDATAAQSAIITADPAAVATDLSTSEVQHQALLSVIASVNKTDLFDLLQ